MQESEVLELKKRLQAEHDADMAAIARVQRLLREMKITTTQKKPNISITQPEQPLLPSTTIPSVHIHANGNSSPTLESKVLDTIKTIKGRFGMDELLVALKNRFPNEEFNKNSISAILFHNKGKAFQVVVDGRGRRKAVYEVVDIAGYE